MAINERVREAILALPEAMWRPAIDGDNQPRDGAWVAELTDHLALDARPEGSRLIVRRERPHPGAQTPARDEQRERRSRPPLSDGRRRLGASPASVARCSLGRNSVAAPAHRIMAPALAE
jgi:hypothetical protein